MREYAQTQSNSQHEASGRAVLPTPRPHRGGLQAKLTVNTPGDVHEREADRFAERVTGTHDSGEQRTGGAAGQTTAPSVAGEVAKSHGQPLTPQTRAHMEEGFGHDFGRVRVHADGEAADAARSVGARAYTLGNNIVFGANQYQPSTPEGQHLIAHELTHVLQQSAAPGVIQRQPAAEGAQAPAAAEPIVPLGDVLPFTPEGQTLGWDGAAILGTGQIEPTSAVGKAVTSGPAAVQALADSIYPDLGKELDTKSDVGGYTAAVGDAAILAAVIKEGINTRTTTYGQLRSFAVMMAALENTGDQRQVTMIMWASQPPRPSGTVGKKAPAEPLRLEMYKTLNRWKGTKEGSAGFESFMPSTTLDERRKEAGERGCTFTTCVEFLGRAQNISAGNAGVKLKKQINADVGVEKDRQKMTLPDGAWVPAKPKMTKRPKPGDIYFLEFAENVYKDNAAKKPENIKFTKGQFSHVGYILSLAKGPAHGPAGPPTEVWETVDGGQGPAGKYSFKTNEAGKKELVRTQVGAERIDRVTRIYHPDTNLITGESNQDKTQRTLTGWVDVDTLQGEYTV